jgi:hypothetical protein
LTVNALKQLSVECDCEHCQKLCSTEYSIPGVPTLREAVALIAGGHARRLATDYWSLSDRSVWYLRPSVVLAPRRQLDYYRQTGPCTFWDKRRHCTIHGTPMKPLECRLAGCGGKFRDSGVVEGFEFYKWKQTSIIRSWDSNKGRRLVKIWESWYDR